MNKLEKRIREVASKMEGKFMGTVPHSVFVEWDSTSEAARRHARLMHETRNICRMPALSPQEKREAYKLLTK